MKKTAIALAIAGLAAASVAQAAPQANTFYAGARAGWSSLHDGVEPNFGDEVKRNSVAYGVFAGYQIVDNLAVELGYDHFGTLKNPSASNKLAKFTNHGASLSLKPSYEVVEGLDVYGRVGAALVRSDYETYNGDQTSARGHSLKVSPVVAAGVEYAIPGFTDLAVRAEYQWIHGVGKDQKWSHDTIKDFTPDIGTVSLGVSYRFGQGAPVVAPEIVNKTFTLNSDVTFAFGKSTLKPEAATTLDGIYHEITQVSNPAVQVNGYADRIGKPAGNLKLSQRRAETVANYLVSKGVDAGSVTATGHGSANPVSGNACDTVKGRKALIACLATDRRVEIQVQGNKQATM